MLGSDSNFTSSWPQQNQDGSIQSHVTMILCLPSPTALNAFAPNAFPSSQRKMCRHDLSDMHCSRSCWCRSQTGDGGVQYPAAFVYAVFVQSPESCCHSRYHVVFRPTAPAADPEGCLRTLRRWCWSRQQPATNGLRCFCTSGTSSSSLPHVAIFSKVISLWHLHRLTAFLPLFCHGITLLQDACFTHFRRRKFSPVDGRQPHTGECPRTSLGQARH